MATDPSTQKIPRDPRDLRIRKQHFPNADELIFSTKEKGFVPLPIVMRKLMRYLTPPEFRLLAYLQTRCSKYMVCFPTLDEIAHDLNLQGRRSVSPVLRELTKKKFISTAMGGGKNFFLIHSPRVAIEHLATNGTITGDELLEINSLLEDLGQDVISVEPAAPKKTVSIRKSA